MKKICMIVFTVALIMSFAACSQAKKEESKAKEAVENVAKEVVEEVKQEVTEEVPAVKPEEALKAFKAYVKEYAESFNNITKDPAKFSKLAGQLNEKVTEMEKIKTSFNKKQIADYQAARDLINKVNNAGK